MKYNKISYLSVALAMGGMMASCSDFLDKEPMSQISPEKYYSTEAQIQAVVLDEYPNTLPSHGNWSYGLFNGDGNTDILKIDSSRKNITIYTSTGTGFSSNLPTNFVNPADYEVFIADINGDGMDDLYAVKRSGEYAATKAFINENYGTSFAMYQGPKSPPVSDCQYLFTADFTGNGKADIFFSGRTSRRP